jgi:hypothetical protein
VTVLKLPTVTHTPLLSAIFKCHMGCAIATTPFDEDAQLAGRGELGRLA